MNLVYLIKLKNSQGLRVDIWSFKQGDAKGVKAGKAIFHLVADIFTCFLWKIIGMPAEVLLEKDLKTYIVTYDSSDRVYEVKVLAKK